MFKSTKDVAENSLYFVVGKAAHALKDVAHACFPAGVERPRDNPLFIPDETYREPLNCQAPRRSFGRCSTHESIQHTSEKMTLYEIV